MSRQLRIAHSSVSSKTPGRTGHLKFGAAARSSSATSIRPIPSKRAKSVSLRAGATSVAEVESVTEELVMQESASPVDTSDEWRWTLNWNSVLDNLVVGSCPRTSQHVQIIHTECGADAIVCLQCDDCLTALEVDFPAVQRVAADLSVTHVHVPIRDFDRPDQARMLPEAILALALLLQEGKKVYVHCTAGINRASLTVIGYLAFVKGMQMNEAVDFLKSRRPVASPHLDVLKDARSNLLATEQPTLHSLAQAKYHERIAKGQPEDGFADWVAAEQETMQLIFQKRLSAAVAVRRGFKAVETAQETKLKATIQGLEDQKQDLAHQVQGLQQQMQGLTNQVQGLEEEMQQLKQKLQQPKRWW